MLPEQGEVVAQVGISSGTRVALERLQVLNLRGEAALLQGRESGVKSGIRLSGHGVPP